MIMVMVLVLLVVVVLLLLLLFLSSKYNHQTQGTDGVGSFLFAFVNGSIFIK